MTADEPSGGSDESRRGLMLDFWHGVAAVYAGALIYAQVWQQLAVDWPLWLVVAFVAEPGAFTKLALHFGEAGLKWLLDKWASRQK